MGVASDITKGGVEDASLKSSLSNTPSPETGFVASGNYIPTYEHEKRLVLKFDLRILPVLAFMYLCNALDKGNLGNAKTDSLEDDLHFKDGQYNIILSVFFVPYVIFAPPIGMLGKKYGPSRVLPIMMFCFGTCTLLGASVRNFGGMMTLRWFLGMAESAFFPLVIYYLTTFYRRGELARRLAIFYAASNIANAFSGLLAFGVFQIESSLPGWRYLFLIEGAVTVSFSLFVYWYLPKSSSEAKFLSEDERKIAFARMQLDSSSIVNEKFDLKEALKAFKIPAVYAWLGIEICLGVPLQSVSLFLPQIVGRLGYDKIKTNLYTVAPNIVGAVVLLILAFTSDYMRLRFPFIALGFLLTFIGFIIYVTIDVEHQLNVAYFACFMMTWGTSAPSVLLSTWYNNNIAHEGRRVTLTSVGVPLANLMGVVSSNIFQNKDAPKYIPALATTAAFGATGAVITLLLGTFMVLDNARRNREQGVKLTAKDVPTERLRDGPASPDFRSGLRTTNTITMAAKAVVPFLVAMMLVTGVCNTLLTKYQDNQCVRDCETPNPKRFEQPVLQTAQMFVGEMGCWLVVLGYSLYKRFVSKTGYSPVAAVAEDEDSSVSATLLPGTETSSESGEVANPLKPAHENVGVRTPLTGWKVLMLALPACCDITGTTLMNVGLLFVAASIYQMTRGALVLFVGLFSVLFLKRTLGGYKWFALFVVVAGVAIVGLAGFLDGKKEDAAEGGKAVLDVAKRAIEGDGFHAAATSKAALRTIIGVLLIAGAQIFTAVQFVLEENIMEKYELEPLKVVGWEGIFGFLVTVICMGILHAAVGRTDQGRYGYFDAREGLYEMTHFKAIGLTSFLIMISIGGFNFFGLSVTRTVSATSRSTIDTCRTLFIWIVSLGLGWETFKPLQILGFALLVYGTFLFNDLVRPPMKTLMGWARARTGEREPLLPEEPIEHH
ncbi:MFS general substrate transporter [Patellaria atrata CBS 101060]|uniref:MFS general substrate transporter n=1 Tax=Patellaria atrata CBS 101060 TaxID=1346257 RepID=A0A9P4S9H4_9PEZI|nr:MFS general substrate transporter [Patellaria atrata CBS 101060]